MYVYTYVTSEIFLYFSCIFLSMPEISPIKAINQQLLVIDARTQAARKFNQHNILVV